MSLTLPPFPPVVRVDATRNSLMKANKRGSSTYRPIFLVAPVARHSAARSAGYAMSNRIDHRQLEI